MTQLQNVERRRVDWHQEYVNNQAQADVTERPATWTQFAKDNAVALSLGGVGAAIVGKGIWDRMHRTAPNDAVGRMLASNAPVQTPTDPQALAVAGMAARVVHDHDHFGRIGGRQNRNPWDCNPLNPNANLNAAMAPMNIGMAGNNAQAGAAAQQNVFGFNAPHPQNRTQENFLKAQDRAVDAAAAAGIGAAAGAAIGGPLGAVVGIIAGAAICFIGSEMRGR